MGLQGLGGRDLLSSLWVPTGVIPGTRPTVAAESTLQIFQLLQKQVPRPLPQSPRPQRADTASAEV